MLHHATFGLVLHTATALSCGCAHHDYSHPRACRALGTIPEVFAEENIQSLATSAAHDSAPAVAAAHDAGGAAADIISQHATDESLHAHALTTPAGGDETGDGGNSYSADVDGAIKQLSGAFGAQMLIAEPANGVTTQPMPDHSTLQPSYSSVSDVSNVTRELVQAADSDLQSQLSSDAAAAGAYSTNSTMQPSVGNGAAGTASLLDFGFGAIAGQAVATKGMPVRQYMEATVVPIVRAGLKTLIRVRPADPLQFVADYLVAHKTSATADEAAVASATHGLEAALAATSQQDVATSGLSVRQYIDVTVVPVLRQGLKALNETRPDDPLQYLADFFVSHKPAQTLV